MLFSVQKIFYRPAVVAFLLLLSACQAEQPWATSHVPGAMPNLSFNLIEANQNKAVTAEDYHGKVVMLFFGFTNCPSVCPTTLLHLQKVLSTLGEKAKQVQVLFVTVDSERDGLQEIKQYTENFGPQTAGLTGDKTALVQLTKTYGVSHENQQADTEGNYDIAHGSTVYVFDRKGTIRLLVRTSDPIDAISHDLLRLLDQ